MKLKDGELNIPVPEGWTLTHDEPQFLIIVSNGKTSVAFSYGFYGPSPGNSSSYSTTLPYLKYARVQGRQYGARYNRLWTPERALLCLAVGRVLK